MSWIAYAALAFGCLASASALAGGDVPEGTELLKNRDFAQGKEGWSLYGAEVRDGVGPGGQRAVNVNPPAAPAKWSHVGFSLPDVPHRRRLQFSAQVSGAAAGQTVQVNAFAYGATKSGDDKPDLASSWSQRLPVVTDAWGRIAQEYVVPDETTMFTLFVISESDAPVLVADLSLVVGGAGKPELQSLNGPGVIRATAAVGVSPATPGAVGTVTFPIPLLQERQVPLTFTLTVDPPEALRGCRWERRADGDNWLAQVEVAPPAGGAKVRWESLVLVDAAPELELPAAERPEVPDAAAAWLKSTACVQSDDAAVAAQAAELAAGAAASDIGAYVRAVIAFTAGNQGHGADFRALDAAAAMACGGSCTSRANLCAALLRAHGLPARTSAHLPTWSGPLYEHWHVEYWHPGAGWVRVEPTMGRMQPQPWTMVVINIANPDDEDRSFGESMSHSNVMLGAPDLAVHRIPPELMSGPSAGANLATCEARVQGNEQELAALFKAARAAFARAAEACGDGRAHPLDAARVEKALETGEAKELAKALR